MDMRCECKKNINSEKEGGDRGEEYLKAYKI